MREALEAYRRARQAAVEAKDRLVAAQEAEADEACDGHRPGDGSWWARDGYGIELCRVCERCEARKMARYRPDIGERYEADEAIGDDGDDYGGFDDELPEY